MTEKLAYSILETAEIANSSRTAIYAAIGRGDLVARKLGKRTVILAEDLRAWLAGLPAFTKQQTGDPSTG